MTTQCSICASEIQEGLLSCPSCESTTVIPASSVPLSSPLFSATTEDLAGLSGWLILIGLGLVVSPFTILVGALKVGPPFLFGSRYETFLTSHRGLAALILFEFITNIIFVAGLLALNYLFFTKRRAFPFYMILYLAAHFGVILIDTVVAHVLMPSVSLPSAYRALAQSFFGALIWIPYFLVSQRVKATFVN